MGRPFVTTHGGYAPRSVVIDLTCDESLDLSDEEDYDIGDEENEDPGIRVRIEEAPPIDRTLGRWNAEHEWRDDVGYFGSVARRRGRFAGIDGSGIELRSLDGVSSYGDQEGNEELRVFRTTSYTSLAGQTIQSSVGKTGTSSSENRIR